MANQKVRNLLPAKEFVALAKDCTDLMATRRAVTGQRTGFGEAYRQKVCYYPELFHGGVV